MLSDHEELDVGDTEDVESVEGIGDYDDENGVSVGDSTISTIAYEEVMQDSEPEELIPTVDEDIAAVSEPESVCEEDVTEDSVYD